MMKTILICMNSKRHSYKIDFVPDHIQTPKLKWLIDTTIAYPAGRPLDLFCILFGHREPCQTVVHHRKYPVADIPRDTEGLTQWLYDRYTEKEKLLGEYYATGEFPISSTSKQELLKVHAGKAWALQTLYLLSFLFHCYLIHLLVNLLCNMIGVFF